MLMWQDIAMQQERYHDLLREAQAEQLVRQAMTPAEPGDRFYCRALIWVGKRLVAWGLRLQERFGSTAPVPTLEPAHLPR